MTESRYTRIKSRFWTDEKSGAWDNDTKLLALYLLSCPHGNILGCFVLPKLYICADLRWTPEQLQRPFAKLLDDDFIEYDEKASLVLVRKWLRHNPIENGNQATAAIKVLQELPKSPLLKELANIVREQNKPHLRLLLKEIENCFPRPSTEPFGERFGEPFPKPFTEEYAKPVTVTVTVTADHHDRESLADSSSVASSTSSGKSTAHDDEGKTLAERLEEMPNVKDFWDNNFYPIRAFEMEELGWFYDQGMEEGLIVHALKKAVAAGKRRLDYVQGILRNYLGDNIFTLQDALQHDKEFEERRKARDPPGTVKKRVIVHDDPEYQKRLKDLNRQLEEVFKIPRG
ncbi:MAG: DnaD domain protein [Firmicutes bacterium]|nr:DnaD domain protein [Bacillota bacterium]